MTALLTMSSISGGYGDADILHDLSMEVGAREIVAIIGPNGAGKSTAMKSIFGLLTIRSGTIVVDGTDITGWAPSRIVRSGICYVPQVANVFYDMTVHENFEMGAFLRNGDYSDALERVYEMFPDMKAKQKALAGSLSGGQRQMVAIGRALMLDPKVLLLDEPTAGLSPKYMEQIFQTCRDIRNTGVALVLVEQHAKQALRFADRGYVLAAGRNRCDGTGVDLLNNRFIAEMFLGA
ncbi:MULTISPECIES: ABC transporter ATP-binding protein [Xanthobacteraceae]|uniref:Branched-chain amino acid transport system ATP-binding protein n=1 Tax=Labrys monachus TaxID=217067 RepID=A0ABU0FFX3_9HYPH|nr:MULTISPECIES: ABC transporter ATP-binding protein [Xanthobacteraceae]MBS7538202.1 ABC transporter ATP-binding protein [Ancylobacter lacus]MDQ0393506.1 branched-chain amino acid transport system ATP-binding protein [Labrys monachus]